MQKKTVIDKPLFFFSRALGQPHFPMMSAIFHSEVKTRRKLHFLKEVHSHSLLLGKPTFNFLTVF